jgi:hypothetical protein
MDRLHFRECSFDAAVLSEIGKHLNAEHHMPLPAFAGLIYLLASPLTRYSSRNRAAKSPEN